MEKERINREVVVVGGGPAGLSAAIEAAKNGAKVTLIDENDRAGGQLFKQIHRFFGSSVHKAGIRGYDIGKELLEETKNLGVEVLLNTVVWGIFKDGLLGIKRENKTEILSAERIIIATGASENPLSFPGWTLPGVMGAGAAQTMMNLHRVLPGRKIVMVGSGNVGLIVSYQLLQAGAEVLAIVEALPRIGGYLVHAAKIRRAGVPILTSHTILQAEGKNGVEKVTISKVNKRFKPVRGTEKVLKADLVCLAVGLTALAELCWMAGCQFFYSPILGGFLPVHNKNMQTSVPHLYLAGDVSGVEEASTAMEEGRLAGIAMAESLGYISGKEAKKKKNLTQGRLLALRQGPFGEERKKEKEKIYEMF